MIKGIFVNGRHTRDFGLRMLKRSIGSAQKDDYTERVPYSNVTYDFSGLYGSHSYDERTLTYRFELIERHIGKAEDVLVSILNWLHWSDRVSLYDDMLSGYYFEVREPSVSFNENHGIYTFDMVFRAAPAMKPCPHKRRYNVSTVRFPDIGGDGIVDASDASAIMQAYTRISTGQDSGLTPEQELLADADMDGFITAADASLVVRFYSEISTGGKYENSVSGWAEFLNDVLGGNEEVY